MAQKTSSQHETSLKKSADIDPDECVLRVRTLIQTNSGHFDACCERIRTLLSRNVAELYDQLEQTKTTNTRLACIEMTIIENMILNKLKEELNF